MKKTTLAITLTAIGALTMGGFSAAQSRGSQGQGGGQADMGAALMEGLLKTPGCLGADAGQFRSGKNVIMAWFEDKKAAARWYHSPTHQHMMRAAVGNAGKEHEHTPLEYVKDGVPIMVVASITFTDQPEVAGIALPISQMAIEIYAPQPGGGHINGRLAPATFKVEHMKAYRGPAEG